MKITKQYVHNSENVVIIVCDHYSTSQIPQNMCNISGNLALFPVANTSIIDLILLNLLEQQFHNIILAGTKLTPIITHIQDSSIYSQMNIGWLEYSGESIGDLFRTIDDLRFEFNNLILIFGNHYTNLPFNNLLKKHNKHKKEDKILATFYVHEHHSNSINKHIYVTENNQLLKYILTASKSLDLADFTSLCKSAQNVMTYVSYSSPSIAIFSNQIFSIFTENFDYHSLGDFITGTLSSDALDFKIKLFTEHDFSLRKKGIICSTEVNEYHKNGVCYYEEIHRCNIKENGKIYNREITTLLDYYNFNKDVGINPLTVKLPGGTIAANNVLKMWMGMNESFIGKSCEILGKIQNTIVWDHCSVPDDCENVIIYSDGLMIDINHLESSMSCEKEDYKEEKRSTTFFEDIYELLHSRMQEVRRKEHRSENRNGNDRNGSDRGGNDREHSRADHNEHSRAISDDSQQCHSLQYDKIDLQDVYKQICLLRIIHHASEAEVIEAFASYFVEMTDANNLEDSFSKITVYFGVLKLFINDGEGEIRLMDAILEGLCEYECDLKAQILFNFGFLLVQENVISKKTVKEYTRRYKLGCL